MNETIMMIFAKQTLAKKLTPKQIVTAFASLRDGSVLSIQDALKLIDAFGILCWQLENEAQQEDCFALLHDILVKLPQNTKGELSLKLMNNSKNYPRFVFLAEELFKSIPPCDRKKLKFYPLGWTSSDDFTLISQSEYEWRIKRGLPSHKEKGMLNRLILSRPMCLLDLLCFEVSLRILIETESKTFIYTG